MNVQISFDLTDSEIAALRYVAENEYGVKESRSPEFEHLMTFRESDGVYTHGGLLGKGLLTEVGDYYAPGVALTFAGVQVVEQLRARGLWKEGLS